MQLVVTLVAVIVLVVKVMVVEVATVVAGSNALMSHVVFAPKAVLVLFLPAVVSFFW